MIITLINSRKISLIRRYKNRETKNSKKIKNNNQNKQSRSLMINSLSNQMSNNKMNKQSRSLMINSRSLMINSLNN